MSRAPRLRLGIAGSLPANQGDVTFDIDAKDDFDPLDPLTGEKDANVSFKWTVVFSSNGATADGTGRLVVTSDTTAVFSISGRGMHPLAGPGLTPGSFSVDASGDVTCFAGQANMAEGTFHVMFENRKRHASFPRGGALIEPVRSLVALASGYRGSMPQARGRRQVGFRRRRVLVVEDDDSFAEALRELLEADGRVEVAGRARDGREAVELADVLRPDVVLMDIVLPVMDGVEATREIRRQQPSTAVVGITGSDYEERALEVREAGAVDFVRKGGSTQTSSKSLSLPRITAAAAGAAGQRAAEQRSSQRSSFNPGGSWIPGRTRAAPLAAFVPLSP